MLASALQEEDAPEGEVAEDPLDVIRLRSLYTNKVSLTHINSFSKRALEHELILRTPENQARHVIWIRRPLPCRRTRRRTTNVLHMAFLLHGGEGISACRMWRVQRRRWKRRRQGM